MRKVFTLFCVLMAAFFSIGVANAQSLVALQTSPKPTGDTFDANTHWFIMTLHDKFITTTVHDERGNLKVSSTNVADISTDQAWWCVVGDDTKGYTFYNKAAGTKKVLGLKNLTGPETDSNLQTYGASRAQMYDATTTNSTDLNGVGITFDLKTSSTDKEYYVCLKGTDRYLNDRNSYLAYWDNSGGLGDAGSRVKFYDASTYWYDRYSLGSYQTLATNARNNMGTAAFTYPESVVTTFENLVTEKLGSGSTNITYEDAIQLDAAKTTLRKSINGPVDNTIYKLLNQIQGNYVHAPLSWTAGQVFPLNRTANDRSIGFIFEKNEDGTYKVKSADTGMYVGAYVNGGYTSTASKDEAVNCYIYAYRDCDSRVIIGTTNDLNGNEWFHGNGTKLFNYPASGENGCWQCTEVSVEEFNNLTDTRSSFTLLPGVGDNEAVIAALNTYNREVTKTVEDWNTLANVVNNVLEGKYYRINNLRNKIQDDYTIMATDGNLKPQMYKSTQSKYLVSTIWKFKVGNGGLLLSNVNNPNQYVAALTNASVAAQGGTANDFTASDNAELFVLSKADNVDYYVIRDVKGNLLNGEDSGNFPINYWNDGLNQKSTQWQINEATSLEVALNNNEVDGKSYASVYLPFSISSVNDGVKAYVAKEPGTNEVTFTETTNGVMANKGFLLISDNAAATATVNIGESTTDSKMLGTLTDLNLTNEDKSTYRVFGRNSSNVGFFTPSGTLDEVKANRGFFTVSNGGALRLNFEDSVVSGIDAIEANQALHNAPIFDLSGRRVMNTVKGGLYIQNGRKFIVK
mgnify:CR=1 FL=1